MPLSTRARRHKTNSVKGKHPAADHQSSDDESAHPRPSTRKLKGPTIEQSDPKATVSEADMATEAPVYEADNSTRPKPQYYLLKQIKKKVTKDHEKLARDEYQEDLKALGEGHAGAWNRKSLEEIAGLKLEAGLKAVQPAIATEMESYKDLIASEYQLFEDRLEKPSRFTREEVAKAHESWVATRTSLGLPVEGDCDDLAPPEPVGRQEEELYSATD